MKKNLKKIIKKKKVNGLVMKVPEYYKVRVEENGEVKEVEIFDIQLKQSKLFTAWHIVSDIQRYIYRFNRKTNDLSEWMEDLNKAKAEVLRLETIKLNWFQRMILKRNRLFKPTSKEWFLFFDKNRHLSVMQTNCLYFLAKLNYDLVVQRINDLISKVQKAKDLGLSTSEVFISL